MAYQTETKNMQENSLLGTKYLHTSKYSFKWKEFAIKHIRRYLQKRLPTGRVRSFDRANWKKYCFENELSRLNDFASVIVLWKSRVTLTKFWKATFFNLSGVLHKTGCTLFQKHPFTGVLQKCRWKKTG